MENTNSSMLSVNKLPFYYGTHYWRPITPPREDHWRHLRKIKNELGFNLIKLRLIWNWHHRCSDIFYFDEVHEIFDICDDIGLNVLIEFSLENAPYWLEHAHPESRYVNANGHYVELGAQEATPSGGHPGLCWHHSEVLKSGEQYIRQIVREFKDRKSLHIYDCWNEPHLEPVWCVNMWGNMGDKLFCYCQKSREAFRTWLKAKYGDIDTFNATWRRAYNCFEHINPPILQGTYADWLDWGRFWFDMLQDHMIWRVRIINEEDPTRQVISHSGAVPPVLPRANAMIHNWKLAEPVAMWGTSFAPQAFQWDMATCAQILEITRSSARGKPFIISEMCGGAGCAQGFKKTRTPRPKDYSVWNWLSVVLGSSGTMHWCYLPETTGHEAGGFGMMMPDGSHTSRSKAISEICDELLRHGDILKQTKVKTDIAIYYDPDISTLLLAMSLNDQLYGNSHTGYYKSIWESDLVAKYVTPDTLDDLDEKVLIVPMALTMSEATSTKLARFVEQGGTLILEARTGWLDENGFTRKSLPCGELKKAAGLTEGEMIPTSKGGFPICGADGKMFFEQEDTRGTDPLQLGPPIAFHWPIMANVDTHEFITELNLNTAEAIGKYENMVLAAHNRYGKGHVYYFGTYFGLALNQGARDAHILLQCVLKGHVLPYLRGNLLRPRLIASGSKYILAVFNDSFTQSVEDNISLPSELELLEIVQPAHRMETGHGFIRITIEPENVAVFILQERNSSS